jgi:hypothetical protein
MPLAGADALEKSEVVETSLIGRIQLENFRGPQLATVLDKIHRRLVTLAEHFPDPIAAVSNADTFRHRTPPSRPVGFLSIRSVGFLDGSSQLWIRFPGGGDRPLRQWEFPGEESEGVETVANYRRIGSATDEHEEAESDHRDEKSGGARKWHRCP